MKTFFNSDRISGLVIMAFGAAVWQIAGTFPKPFLDPVGPTVYPRLLAVLFMVPGLLLFLTGKGENAGTETPEQPAQPAEAGSSVEQNCDEAPIDFSNVVIEQLY